MFMNNYLLLDKLFENCNGSEKLYLKMILSDFIDTFFEDIHNETDLTEINKFLD